MERRITWGMGGVVVVLVAMLLLQLLVIHSLEVKESARGTDALPTSVPATGIGATASPVGHMPTPVPTSIQSAFITRAIARTNYYRAKYAPTCPQLAYNAALTLAAYRHSADMALHGVLTHSGSDGSSVPQRLSAAGYHYTTWAENVTWYAATPEAAVDDWFNETPPNDGHRRNILGCTLHDVGIGYYYDPHDPAGAHNYWTEDFGAQG